MRISLLRVLWRLGRWVVMLTGIAVILLLALCFTSYPWRLYWWLGSDREVPAGPMNYVVVLGGGGIPSESGLMRSYTGAETARWRPETLIIVALPADENRATNNIGLMIQELTMRGVAPDRILTENRGRNTREQALNVAGMLGKNFATNRLVIISSPEHMRRALAAFHKVGFPLAYGISSFDHSVDAELGYDSSELGGPDVPMLDVGDNIVVRYQFWNNLNYLVKSSRELVALAYYKAMGWI